MGSILAGSIPAGSIPINRIQDSLPWDPPSWDPFLWDPFLWDLLLWDPLLPCASQECSTRIRSFPLRPDDAVPEPGQGIPQEFLIPQPGTAQGDPWFLRQQLPMENGIKLPGNNPKIAFSRKSHKSVPAQTHPLDPQFRPIPFSFFFPFFNFFFLGKADYLRFPREAPGSFGAGSVNLSPFLLSPIAQNWGAFKIPSILILWCHNLTVIVVSRTENPLPGIDGFHRSNYPLSISAGEAAAEASRG